MSESDNAVHVDVSERTKAFGGKPAQVMDRRLFMQLLVFECQGKLLPTQAIEVLAGGLTEQKAQAVIYADMNNPKGIALLSWSEDPSHFVAKVRPAFVHPGLSELKLDARQTMVGRTYSTGYEPDLQYWLLQRPVETVMNPEWPWAVWYPLRRSGAFERLEDRERGSILREHAEIGKAYGAANLAHDVRLACHGLDGNDNEFVIGLIGKELHPLSHVVQAMRRTRQTSEYIEQMGPFFVGHAAWRSAKAGG